jgi:hypothetical protein
MQWQLKIYRSLLAKLRSDKLYLHLNQQALGEGDGEAVATVFALSLKSTSK